ncbi:unnamed protein product [Cuscuta epithymum]|uniref:non-specific serine/threonine protein kinase n=1 Tax=Cuscuta epithymum TaxID=186058 RepID=A0AAV0CG38_9ASTE|nr:unnamed protein product [Cuscuta epithymum]
MKGSLVYRLFILILCLALTFGAPPDYEGPDLEAELSSSSEYPPPNSPLSLTPKDDTAIVAAPDGMIHLVELSSGKILWSFTSGPSIYTSFQSLPDNHANDRNVSTEGEIFYLDCGEDWKLYLHGDDFDRVEISQSIEEFIKQTPYVLDGGIMLGSKRTTAFHVNHKTGRVIHMYGSDMLGDEEAVGNPIMVRNDLEDWKASSETDNGVIDSPLYIIRTDYALKYTSTKTGKVLWNLHVADFEASLHCEQTEKFLGGLSSQGQEFAPDKEGCQTKPFVYRIRDRSSLESFFMTVRSQNTLPGGTYLSLPAADHNYPVIAVDKIFRLHQNKKGKVFRALPAPSTDGFAIMGLPAGDNNQVVIESNFLTGSYLWSFVIFGTIVLLIVAIIFYMASWVINWNKLRSEVVDKKVEVTTTKKKKLRKSGISQRFTNTEKIKKMGFNHETSLGHGFPDMENIIHEMQVNLFDRHSGVVDGRKIGKLFLSQKEIAKGSNGTVILEGIYDGRPVAVKRLVKAHHDIALKEIQNLIASDQHPNIVRWYGVEYDQDFVYLSLERCTCSLYDFVSAYSSFFEEHLYATDQYTISRSDCKPEGHWSSNDNYNSAEFELWKTNGYPSQKLLKLLSDIVNGLVHLHELGIIHRDLKPQNVLVVKKRIIRAKISDMGISKRLVGDFSSLTKHATGNGSSGWQAPEQLRHERQTRAVDLFSLGCVMFFCITGGKHPYGQSLERDTNIVNDRKDLFLIENMPEAIDLISQLLHPNPDSRPTAVEVLNHPFFWKPETRLSFLRDASDRLELEDRDSESEILTAVESIKTVALGGSWDAKMDSAFINDIGRYRRYKFDSVRDLLRVIRNKLNHYRELSMEIQGLLGQVPEGFDSYFSSRFPSLVVEVYKVIQRYCADEQIFRIYFQNNHI